MLHQVYATVTGYIQQIAGGHLDVHCLLLISDYLQDSCSCSALHTLECDSYTLPPVQYGAGHVALSRQPGFYRHFYCQFTIQAPPNMKVQLTLNDISIPKSRACKSAVLKIFDGIPEENTQWPMTGRF